MDYKQIATRQAQAYGVDPALYHAVIQQESGWNPNATSPVGARGIAQIMPKTGAKAGYGVAPVQFGNVEDELRFGAQYLSAMIKENDGDVRKGLAAYNAGQGRVLEAGGVPDIPETQNYVSTIMGNYEKTKPLTVVKNLDGTTPVSEIERIANNGILSANEDAAIANLQKAPIGQGGDVEVTQQEGVLNSIAQAPEDEQKGLMAKFFPDLSPEQRNKTLLAIGAGILQGDDWGEGMAAAGQNLLGLSESEANRQLRREQLESQNSTRGQYNSPVNISGIDPTTGQKMVKAGTVINGVPHVLDEKSGQMIPASSVMSEVRFGGRNDAPDVTKGAGNIPNATYVSASGEPSFTFQREGEQKMYRYARRAIAANADLDAMMTEYGPETFTSVQAGLEQWAAQNARAQITPALVNSILDSSGIQGSARSAMSSYLQAVLRADTGAAYTGTEIADYAGAFLPNTGDDPETAAYKSQVRQRELLGMAGASGAAAPYLLGVIDGTYELTGGDWKPVGKSKSSDPSQLTSEVEDILKLY